MTDPKIQTLQELEESVQELTQRVKALEKPYSVWRFGRVLLVQLPLWVVPFGFLWGLGVSPEWAARFALAIYLSGMTLLLFIVVLMRGSLVEEVKAIDARLRLFRASMGDNR